MKYAKITPSQAKELGGFWPPHIINGADFDKYYFYICCDDKDAIVAAAAVDPRQDGAVLLSIGVSSGKEHQGIGTGLLKYITDRLSKQYAAPDSDAAALIRVTESMSADDWKIPDAFLLKNGFSMDSSETLNCIPLVNILHSEVLKEALHHSGTDRLVSLKEVSDRSLNAFSNMISSRKLYPSISRSELDKDITTMWMEGDTIKGCILMSHTGEGDKDLINEWVYMDPEVKDRSLLIKMFAKSTLAASKHCKSDTMVYFLPVADSGKKLLSRILPDCEIVSELRSYTRPLAPDSPPIFNEVTEKGTVCENCVFSIGNLAECEKYSVKPGAVVYGGDCSKFSPAQ